jgi:alkylation response protein AidB-like acyl-CoA dehydrogenase
VDFAFSPDQELLRGTARAFLEEHVTPATVRALWNDARGERDDLWKEMARLGWLGLAIPEEHGGSALGLVETAIVLEELGRVACPGPYLETVVLARSLGLAGSAAQQARWLPAIAGGAARGTVAFLDVELNWSPDAVRTRAESGPDGIRLTGVKQWVPWAHVADVLLVPAHGPDGFALFLVESGAPGLHVSPVPAMDPGMRWATVRLDGVRVPPAARVGESGTGAGLLGELLGWGAVGAAATMLGAARRSLDLSVEYAKVREQFGQPIGSFQAIRHRCAEMLLEVENAHAATYYAAWAQDANAEDRALAASVAKAYVSDAARKVCGDAIQVHGGIGFTWEYDLHLYFKRAKTLEATWGDADYHRELIVRQVAG